MSPLVVSALLMGLLGGVHCVAMCGGVVSVLCSAVPRCPAAKGVSRIGEAPYWILYNVGRVGSYVLLGFMFGGLGSLSTGIVPLEPLRFGLRAIAAICMLFVGLHLAGLPTIIPALESLGMPLWSRISPWIKRWMPLRSPWHAMALGGLWGLMPCGLLYGALLLAASAESAALGAATMAAFGVGTLPVLLTMSALAQGVSKWLSRGWVRRVAGALVFAFGVWSSVGVAGQVGIGAELGIAPRHHCCPKAAP